MTDARIIEAAKAVLAAGEFCHNEVTLRWAEAYARAAIVSFLKAKPTKDMIREGVTAPHGRNLGERVTESYRAMTATAAREIG